LTINLQNTKISLRLPEPDDLEFLYNLENNTSNWHVSNTRMPFSKSTLQKYIENSHIDIYTSGQIRFLIINKIDNCSIGAIDLYDFDGFHQRAGIGIIISDHLRGQGFGSAAVSLIEEYSFSYLLLHQLYCHIEPDNKQSIALFRKHNYKHTGTLKAWNRKQEGYSDEFIFQKLV